jgi:hypothetical protein
MKLKIALFGAAGKMGSHITSKIGDDPDYDIHYVEAGEVGESRLRERGIIPTDKMQASREADIIILGVPDTLIGTLCSEIVPIIKTDAIVICLDPAAPWSGVLPKRDDITYFVTHPCHPPVINDETDPEARRDCFGGIAKQGIVCALMQGPEDHYDIGEKLSRKMFAPVTDAHRLTVEQIAILEPALAETTVLTCVVAWKEALEEAIKQGVPPDAARDFLMGHIHVNIGIIFGFVDRQVSDGAKMAAKRGMEKLFKPDWKDIFQPENVLKEVKAIAQG